MWHLLYLIYKTPRAKVCAQKRNIPDAVGGIFVKGERQVDRLDRD